MINLNNYFAFHPMAAPGENSVYWMILKYFKSHPGAVFPTQTDLCDSLKKEFNLEICTQSAISKALKNLYKKDIKIGEEVFTLLKDRDGYHLQKKDFGKISDLLGIEDVFEKEKVHKLSANTLVFSFKEGGAEKFKDELLKIYPEDVFFKLLVYDNTLFIMFNEDNSRFSENFVQMSRFFIKREEFKKRLEKERKALEEFRAAQRKTKEEKEEAKRWSKRR